MMNFPTSARTSNRGETFHLRRNFPTSKEAFQLHSVLSNFARFFANFNRFFPTSAKLSNFRLSNFSFFPTALSYYTYPKKSNLWPGAQDFCLDFVSRNDARWRTQKKFFEIFLDFVSENDARWRTQFLDFVSEICQYGLSTFHNFYGTSVYTNRQAEYREFLTIRNFQHERAISGKNQNH